MGERATHPVLSAHSQLARDKLTDTSDISTAEAMGDAHAAAGADGTPAAAHLNGVTAEEGAEGKVKVSPVPPSSLSQAPSAASAGAGGGGAASTPASSTAGNGGAAPAERPKKRRRTGKACASCRRRKTRCDGGSPCEACKIGEMCMDPSSTPWASSGEID